MKQLQTIRVPACSKEFARTVERVFAKIDIKPGMSLETIMFNAGQQKVVDYLLKVSHEQIVSGDPDELTHGGNTGALNKALGNRQ